MQSLKRISEGNTALQKIYLFLDKYLIWLVAGVMLAISIIHIFPPYNADIINYDSSYQYFLTRHSLNDIFLLIPEDYSPPLYAILLKVWTYIFGDTLEAMRAFSIVIIWGLIFLGAFPVRSAFGRRASVICMLMYTLSFVNFVLVPEIRPTVLAYFLLAASAIYAYLAFFYEYRYAYVCMTIFSVLAMYTHNVAMLAVLSYFICILILAVLEKNLKKVISFFICGGICAVCYIPWLLVVIRQFENVKKNYWSSGNLSVDDIVNWTYSIHFSQKSVSILALVAAAPIVITLVILLLKLRKYNMVNEILVAIKSHILDIVKIVFVICLYVGPIVMLVLFSVIAHPIIVARYFYIFGAVMVIMLSAFIGKFAGKKTYTAFIAVLIMSFFINLYNVKKSLDESDFLDMIEQISQSDNGDIAFLHIHEWSLGIMMYYFPDAEHYVCDDTWCVLNTLDVFPTEVIDIGNIENITEYEEDFYVFGGMFPDSPYALDRYFMEDDRFYVTYIGDYSEPYTYKKGWSLYNVSRGD